MSLLTPLVAEGDGMVTRAVDEHIEYVRIKLATLPVATTEGASKAKTAADGLIMDIITRMADLEEFRAHQCSPTPKFDHLGVKPVECDAFGDSTRAASPQRASRGGVRFLDR